MVSRCLRLLLFLRLSITDVLVALDRRQHSVPAQPVELDGFGLVERRGDGEDNDNDN